MKTFSKKQISNGVRNMSVKAISWSAVCKQLSGIDGMIKLDDMTNVSPLELMQTLGVHVLKNHYTPKDIFTAWSVHMKKNEMIHIAKDVGYKVAIGDKTYQLFSEANKAKAVRRYELCKLVSAADKQKGSTDVCVTVQNILRGLQQSIYISETLKKIAKSVEKCEALTSGWVNMARAADEPIWVPVTKNEAGDWCQMIKKVA